MSDQPKSIPAYVWIPIVLLTLAGASYWAYEQISTKSTADADYAPDPASTGGGMPQRMQRTRDNQQQAERPQTAVSKLSPTNTSVRFGSEQLLVSYYTDGTISQRVRVSDDIDPAVRTQLTRLSGLLRRSATPPEAFTKEQLDALRPTFQKTQAEVAPLPEADLKQLQELIKAYDDAAGDKAKQSDEVVAFVQAKFGPAVEKAKADRKAAVEQLQSQLTPGQKSHLDAMGTRAPTSQPTAR